MNRGLKNLDSFLAKHDKIVITTHESPDPDGIGAEVAFYEVLKFLGKYVLVINSDKTPEKYHFMDPSRIIHMYSDQYKVPDDINEFGLVILDTNDKENIGALYRAVKDRIHGVFIIDHHSRTDSDNDENFINSTYSSTSEMIYEIIEKYKVPINISAAMPLYAGILFDTGSFRYPKTSPKTFQTVSHLVEAGVSPTWVYDTIYESYSLSSLVLKSKMLSSMEFYHEGQMVIMYMTPEMLIETGGMFSEGEHNINIPLTVKNVLVSILIKQDINGPIKVSMRTKGDLDVADIAFEHKGGGHKNAAGYKSYVSWLETKNNVIADMDILFSAHSINK
jgi:phosphoesterase RecJ-like protein